MTKNITKILALLLIISLLMTSVLSVGIFAEEGAGTGESTGSTGDTESGDTESGDTESGDTESGGTESGGTESGDTESGGTESGGTESGGTESGGTESGGTESGGTESGGTESGGTDSDDDEPSLDVIEYSGSAGKAIEFDGDDFVDEYKAATGKTLRYIKITTLPSSTKGILYYAYGDDDDEGKIDTSDKLEEEHLDDTSFVAKKEGTVTIPYKAYGKESGAPTLEGEIKITVEDTDELDDIVYTVYNNKTLSFKGKDFDEACEDATGKSLQAIVFRTLPSSTQGVLYCDDEKISTSDEFYYDDDPDISDIDFVPKKSYSGTISLRYRAYYTSSKYLDGKITIKVKAATTDDDEDEDEDDEDYDVDSIKDTIDAGDEWEFDGDDIYDNFEDSVDEELMKIKFTKLPSSTQGAIYYDYDGDDEEKITTSDSFDVDEISDLTFVSKSSYDGKVTINYRGYYTSTKYYDGQIIITVEGDDYDDEDEDDEDEDYDVDTIKESIDKGDEWEFDGDDIYDNFEDSVDEELMKIKFTKLPSSTQGAIYYDYDGDDEEKITTADSFDIDEIFDLTFVPKSTYEGKVTITYRGYYTSSKYYEGQIVITVGDVDEDEDEDDEEMVVRSTASVNQDVIISASKMASEYKDATGKTLHNVKFDLPSSSQGVLYYDYGGESESKVSSSKRYYASTIPSYKYITFVPAKNFVGTVTIKFYAYSSSSSSAEEGEIKITYKGDQAVTPTPTPAPGGGNSFAFSDVSATAWYASAVNAVCNAGLMKGMSATIFSPEGNMTVAEAITMAARLHNSAKGGKDTDFVQTGTWYTVYVNYAINNGIISANDFVYSYDRAATRAEMAYIFYHSVSASALTKINSWTVPDVQKSGKYGQEIYGLYDAGILTGSDSAGTFNPGANITRAEAATILGRTANIISRVKK